MKNKREVLLPFILALFVILLDQITKIAVVAYAPPSRLISSFFGDFLQIILVYNKGAAFSLGNNFAPILRFVVLKLLPILLIIAFLPVYFKSDFSKFERWGICAIIGGGLGNLIDRFFRPEGVVDFIDVKFYGLFGLERWPTFNVADMAVVISFVLLLLHNFFKKKQGNNSLKRKRIKKSHLQGLATSDLVDLANTLELFVPPNFSRVSLIKEIL
ncbi:MAG: signal peptidase II [Treponema sp.]